MFNVNESPGNVCNSVMKSILLIAGLRIPVMLDVPLATHSQVLPAVGATEGSSPLSRQMAAFQLSPQGWVVVVV